MLPTVLGTSALAPIAPVLSPSTSRVVLLSLVSSVSAPFVPYERLILIVLSQSQLLLRAPGGEVTDYRGERLNYPPYSHPHGGTQPTATSRAQPMAQDVNGAQERRRRLLDKASCTLWDPSLAQAACSFQ